MTKKSQQLNNISKARLRSISAQNRARIRLLGRQTNRRGNLPRGNTIDNLPSLRRYTAPRQMTASNKSRIIHREPLGTLNGSQAFAITTFQINPGLASTFPWLAPQALGYESYKVNRLQIEYKFTTNEFTGLGRVVIAPDYDAADAPPTSMVQAEQMVDNVMGAVAKNWTCTLRPRGIGILGPKRYTRSGALSPNEDIKTYDIAQVHICTSGQSSTDEIGQLWISYDITLFEPQPSKSSNIFLAGALLNPEGTGATITNLLGTAAEPEGSILITHVNNVFTLSNLIQGQDYWFSFHVQAATITNAPTFATDNVNLNSIGDLTTLNGTTTDAYVFATFSAVASSGQITLGGITVLTTPSLSEILVMGIVPDTTFFT